MYEFKDLARLTSVATWVILVYLVLDVLASAGMLIQDSTVGADALGPVAFLVLAYVAALIVCVCVVGRWIYVASANAHTMRDDMTISPGWAVGWYFVPIANLFKPLQAMKEIWFTTHESNGGYEERAPALVGWWWGLWIVNMILENVSFRLDMMGAAVPSDVVGLISAAVNVPLCIVLVMMMREMSSSQRYARHALAFV